MLHRSWPNVVRWLLVVAIPPLLVAIALRVVTSPWIVHWEYNRPGFPPDPYGLSLTERTQLASVCVEYLRTDADIDLLAALNLPDGTPAFNERELSHMADVQHVLRQLLIVGDIAGAFVLLGGAILFVRRATRQLLAVASLNGSLLIAALLVGIGIYMSVDWNGFFTAFHRVCFHGDSWLFAYSDTLIRLFPIPFWVDVAIALVGIVGVGALVLGVGGYVWYRRLRRYPAPV
ncbi:MAG: TIGR01906 family membrane protein [Chloroflexi bacterium]|nr:TIGR01906 family membrane protein [Chloroflexota bacterium]